MVVEKNKHQAYAVCVMILGALGYSLIPLVVEQWNAVDSVAAMVGYWALAYGVIGITAAHAIGSEIDIGISTNTVLRNTPWWVYAVTFFGALQWVFFVWSSQLTETAVTTVIFESWPILVLVGRRLFKSASGKKQLTASDMALVAAAGLGLALLILSEGMTDAASFSAAGVALATLGLVAVAASVVAVLNGGEIAAERLVALSPVRPSHVREAALRTRASALARGLMWIGAGAALLIFASASSEVFSVRAIWLGITLGVLHGGSSLAFTFANHLSRSDTINSLIYMAPAMALGWLWIFTDVSVANPKLFAAGAIGIIVVNAFIHARSETRDAAPTHPS